MKRFRLAGALMIGLAAGGPSARAGDGTWTTTAGGSNWSTAANWTNAIVADGAGSTGNFATVDIAVDTTVHLDTPRTLGALVFGDTVTNTAAGWTLDNNDIATNILTLAGGTPLITVNGLGSNKCATVNGILAGTAGLVKAGAGNLALALPATYTGTTTNQEGTLSLAGGHNTLVAGQSLVVNGGTVDLGAGNQYIGTLSSATTGEGTGGTLTGSGLLTVYQSNTMTFAGSISGGLNVVKSGYYILNLTSPNSTTGSVSVIGGRIPYVYSGWFQGNGMSLIDGGTLSGATNFNIKYSSLVIDNTGTKDMSNRVNDAATITLDSGAIILNGGTNVNSTESIGVVTAASGNSFITAWPNGTGSSQLTLAGLTRNACATLLLDHGTTLDSANGSQIFVTGGLGGNLTPVNSVIPGVWNGSVLLCFDVSLGFGRFNAAGFPSTYGGALDAAAATDNVRNPSATVVKSGGQTINSYQGGTMTFANADDTLTLSSGMFLINTGGSGGTVTLGSTGTRGKLTSGLGSGELFLLRTATGLGGTTNSAVHSVITDNGPTRVKFVISCAAQTDAPRCPIELTASNSYSGGTFVNGQQYSPLTLNASSSGWHTIPAADNPADGLVINNASVVMSGFSGQIHPSNIVTLNGAQSVTSWGSPPGFGTTVLTLTGNNTLAGLVFNSIGGWVPMSVVPGGVLTITGDIISNPSNVMSVPIISGNTLDLNSSTSHDITVSAMPEGNVVNNATPLVGLEISSLIQNGGFTKKGTGVLKLSSASSTYGGPVAVENGALSVAVMNGTGSNGPLGTNAAALPLGGTGTTGLLEYTGGTTTSSRSFTLASGGVGGFQVDSAGTTLTISGTLDGGGGLLKTGPGKLVLSGAKTYTGATTTVGGGILSLGPTNRCNSAGIIVGDSPANSGAILDVTASGFQVVSNQVLSGCGTVNGDVSVLAGGHVAAGGTNATGAMAFSKNNLTLGFTDGAVLDYDIGGSNSSPTSDRVVLSGTNSTVAFGAGAVLVLAKVDGSTIRDPFGQTFVLFQYTGSDPVLPIWTIRYGHTDWGHGIVSVDSARKRVILSNVMYVGRGTVLSIQ